MAEKFLKLDHWVDLAIEFFDFHIGTDLSPECFQRVPKLAPMGFSAFKRWQNRHGLKTYKDTGAVFEIERQAVHNWLTRDSFPSWLPLACEAINLRSSAKTGKSHK